MWGCPGTAQARGFCPSHQLMVAETPVCGLVHWILVGNKTRSTEFESCLNRTASFLFCDCTAPPERLLRPNCTLQLTVLTVGTQDSKHSLSGPEMGKQKNSHVETAGRARKTLAAKSWKNPLRVNLSLPDSLVVLFYLPVPHVSLTAMLGH